MSELVVTSLQLEMQRYERTMQNATRLARQYDIAVQDSIKTLTRFENSANALKPIKIDFETDTSTLDKADADVKSLDGMTANVEIDVDSSQVVRVETAIDQIDGATPNVEPTVDLGDINTLKTRVDAVDGATPDIEPQVDKSQLDDLKGELDAIKKLAVIDVALNVAGAMGGIGSIPIVGEIANLDTEASRIEGSLNKTIPNIKDLLTNITGTGLTDAAGAANAIIEVEKLSNEYGDLETVVTNTFQAAKIRGIEFSQQLTEASKLVDAGLAPSLEKANEALVILAQTGGDAGGGIGGAIDEFARTFEGAGLTLDEFVVMSGEAMSIGARNVEMMGETFLSLRETMDEALATGEGDAYQVLVDLELTEQAEQYSNGEISGVEFAKGYQEAINKQLSEGVIDAATANNMTTTLMGSYAVDQGFLDIDWSKVQGAVLPDNVIDESIQKFNTGLMPAIDNLGAAIQEQILDKFGGMDKVLDDVTAKINTITELIQGGTALPEALEIALQAPGLADTINTFASTANNLILEFLTGVANVVEGLGNKQAADDIRGYIADAAEGQLTFDLKLADDAREALDALNTAERRGVDPAIIEQMANMASVELVAEGQIEDAQELVKTLNEIPQGTISITASVPDEDELSGFAFKDVTLPLDIDEDATQDEIDKAVEAAKQAFIEANPGANFRWGDSGSIAFNDLIDTSSAQSTIDKTVNDLKTQFETAMDNQDWIGAFDIASKLNNPALVAEAQAAANETITDILNVFNPFATDGTGGSGAADGGDAARKLADTQIIVSDTAKQFDTLKEAIDANVQPAQDVARAMGDVIGPVDDAGISLRDMTTAVQESDLWIGIFGVTVDEQMSVAATNLQTYGDQMIEQFNFIRDAAKETSNEIAGITVPSGTGGGGAATMDRNAAGGTFSGLSLVGEEGREIIASGTAMSVLNNRTTEALLAGLSMGLGGGSSSTTNNNVNIINNNQGMAARSGADTRVANMIRGY